MYINLHYLIAMSTPMSTTAIIALSAHVHQYSTVSKNGHVTMMAMVFEKFTPIAQRACGRAYATSCVLFVVRIRNTFQVMSLFMNAGSI
jgi:hypothetical protein